MAMFGGETTTVTTPDGRTMVLPSEIAAQFPGLVPSVPPQALAPPPPPEVTAPAPLPSGGAPTWSPADAAGLAAVTPPPDASAAPVVSPTQVPDAGPEVAPMSRPAPVTAPGPDQGAQPVAPPPQLTNAQLAAQGPAGTLAAENRAMDAQQAAIDRSAQVDADAATKEGAIMAARDAQTQAILQERARVAAANQAELDRRMRERDAVAAQIANTRIDRSIDHPVWAAIGIALGALGGALTAQQTHTPFHNQAFDTLMQAIDRKVAGQMEDLDNRRKSLAQMGIGIAEQRQAGADRLAEIDVRRDAALQQAKQTVDTMATQMRSPQALANAQQLKAKIDEVRAQSQGAAAERVQAQINADAARKQAAQFHADTIGMQRLQLQHEDARFYYGQQMAEKEKLAALSERLLERGDKQAAERAKLASEQGVVDPKTGNLLLTPAGEKKMADADQAEANARQASDPAEAHRLNQYASDLRDSARTNDAAVALNKKGAEEAQKALDTTHVVNSLATRASDLLEGDPSSFDRARWAEIKTKIADVKARYVATLGERVSVRALEAFDDVLSIDPDSMWSRATDKTKAIAALKVLRDDSADNANSALKSAGIKSAWSPGRTESTVSFAGKTAQELGNDAEPGGPSPVDAFLGGSDAVSQRARDAAIDAANERRGAPSRAEIATAKKEGRDPVGPRSDYGLDPADDARVRELIARSRQVGNAAYGDIVQNLARPLAVIDRPGLDVGVARLIQDQDPKLLADVLKQVADAAGDLRAKEIRDAIKPIAISAPVGTMTPAARAELAAKEARLREGKPIGTYSEAPSNWKSMSPDARAKYNVRIKAMGFPEVRE